MHLKRLTCQGFKSFADKTHFDFESNLTGIVGPNGCGKSNVVDALKWVLGDQRARSLRGKEMLDVIFKGAEGREGAHQAEVLVTLVDEAGAFGERTEVTVGRRLNREKESDYLLNGERVRLKDVRDILMDTGLGVGAYSVMEQGRIDAVLSANPEDRRAIFEEAAGISRFKLQKRETLRKLDRTEQNLSRVKDLLEERARRIRSLKIQAGKARRYRELRAELRDLRAAVAVVEGRRLRAEQGEIQAQLAALEAELEASEERLDSLQGQRDELEAEIERCSEAFEAAAEELRACQSRREAAEHSRAGQRQRADELRADAEKSAVAVRELEQQHAEKLEALAESRQRLETLEQDLITVGKQQAEVTEVVKQAQLAVREIAAEREQLRRRVLEWMNDRTRAQNTAREQRKHLESLVQRIAKAAVRETQLEADLDRIEAEVHGAECAEADSLRHIAELEAEEAVLLDELHAADEEAAELSRAESELRQELSAVAGRRQVLEDMESHMEGLDAGPRFLLERQPPGLQGRLVDLVETDLEHSGALEAALGPYVQALVVESREHADAMHALLRAEGKGRALLLVEKEIPDDLLKERPLLNLPAKARRLTSVVQYPGYARCLVHWLLRGVCLVDDLADARPDRQDLCFVTPEGSLVCGPRLEGGSKEGQGGLVVRKAQLQALQEQASALEAQLEELLGGKQAVADRVAALKEEHRGLGEELQQERGEQVAAAHRRAGLLPQLEGGARELETWQLEGAGLEAELRSGRALLNDQCLSTLLLRRLENTEAAREAELDASLERAQAHAQDLGRRDQELQLRQASMRAEREAARDASRMHEQGLRELRDNREALEARRERDLQGAEQSEAEVERCEAQIVELDRELESLGERRDEASKTLSGARERFNACKLEMVELQGEAAAKKDQSTQLRLSQGDVDHKFTWLEQRLDEDVGISLRRCLGEVEGFGHVLSREFGPQAEAAGIGLERLQGPPIPDSMLRDSLELRRLWEEDDFDADACAKEVKVAQSRIERLGSVNLDAVTELEDEESDFVLTEQEVKDLTDSRTALVEALRKMEAESRTLFEDTFGKARENFQVIFRKLFQGGRADMHLTEGEDSLEGGIDIVAQPPGKQLQSINLLSGGERTLTALAILFAVFKVKPSPFCILDEVDAALDDTNVERFLRVLDDFVGPTQFCIVTHHKRTMAACDTLYGITMQRRGISSRIAVALDEVDQFSGTGRRAQRGEQGKAENQRIAGEEAIGF